jgi:prophage tail gpP-like protein
VSDRVHTATIVVNGVEIRGLTAYDITVGLLNPVHSFTIELPFSREAWDRCRPDSPVRFRIDGVTVLAGFIDDRTVNEDGEDLRVIGRNRAGRLVQESAPGIEFKGMDLAALIGQLSAPWYTKITLSNARNRRVLRGKGKLSRTGTEPVFLSRTRGRRIEPGQMRMDVMQELCQQAELLLLPAGDGTELILCRPNYDQAPQFSFFQPAAGSRRARASNVLGLSYTESTGDRYSEIVVVGSGGGTDANYGVPVASRIGRVKVGVPVAIAAPVVWGVVQPLPEYAAPAYIPAKTPIVTRAPRFGRAGGAAVDSPRRGSGIVNRTDFSAPKRLVIERAVRSAEEATAYAQREMTRRDMQGRKVTVRASTHGQVTSGQYPTLFAPDLSASIEDERTGMRGVFHIVECVYRSTRGGAEETTMELVPRGQELSL